MTIQYKCNYCGQIRLGMKEQVYVPWHIAVKSASPGYLGNLKFREVGPYYICENCKEYDRQKYLEEV